MKNLNLLKISGCACVIVLFLSFTFVFYNWNIERDTAIRFNIRYMFGQTCNGSIGGLQGTIRFDTAQVEKSHFDVTLDISSIKTGNRKRDEHLQTEDYFNAAAFPTVKFKSGSITKKAAGIYSVTGDLTIKSITKQVSIPFTFTQNEKHRGMFHGDLKINRLDFGIGKKTVFLQNEVIIEVSVPVSLEQE
jgi:polyisoprenoid-binding protein YceI